MGVKITVNIRGIFELAGNSSYRGFELSGFNCSRYWNRKELLGSSSTNNSLLLVSILQNIECKFIIYCHGNRVTTFASKLSLIMTILKVPFGSSIDYDNFFEIAVCQMMLNLPLSI